MFLGVTRHAPYTDLCTNVPQDLMELSNGVALHLSFLHIREAKRPGASDGLMRRRAYALESWPGGGSMTGASMVIRGLNLSRPSL